MSSNSEAVVKRRWEELWNRGDLTVADEIISPDFTNHDPSSPWVPNGLDGCKTLVKSYGTVFPDLQFSIEQQVAAGDTVVSHWRCRGTHRGELMVLRPRASRWTSKGSASSIWTAARFATRQPSGTVSA
jgi:hypothetical protein